MDLHVKRRRETVDLILDQAKAQEIVDLGKRLDQAKNSHPATEAGVDPIALDYARRIEELKQAVAADTVTLELEALPYSAWKQVLDSHTTIENGRPVQNLMDVVQDSIRLMLRSVTRGNTPVDASPDEIADLIEELPDGQFTPVWNLIIRLNGTIVDPKDAIESASRILTSSASSASAASSASVTNAGTGGRHASR